MKRVAVIIIAFGITIIMVIACLISFDVQPTPCLDLLESEDSSFNLSIKNPDGSPKYNITELCSNTTWYNNFVQGTISAEDNKPYYKG